MIVRRQTIWRISRYKTSIPNILRLGIYILVLILLLSSNSSTHRTYRRYQSRHLRSPVNLIFLTVLFICLSVEC